MLSNRVGFPAAPFDRERLNCKQRTLQAIASLCYEAESLMQCVPRQEPWERGLSVSIQQCASTRPISRTRWRRF